MSGYVLSADAGFDLDSIREYIAADSIDAADRWIEKLFNAFEALGQLQERGLPVPNVGQLRLSLNPRFTRYPPFLHRRIRR